MWYVSWTEKKLQKNNFSAWALKVTPSWSLLMKNYLESFHQNKLHWKTKYNWYISWLVKTLDTLGPLGLKFPSSLTLIRFAFTFSAEKIGG